MSVRLNLRVHGEQSINTCPCTFAVTICVFAPNTLF